MVPASSSQPLVSVIVATNRGGPFLAEALASVEAQTYENMELVVVDDGSPDPAALRGILQAVPSATLVRIDASGVSTARNHGVTHTHGELLVFLDDDDRWHPERLTRHVAAMTGRPDAVVSYCRMDTIDADGALLVTGDQRAASGPADVIRGRAGIMLPNLVIRRAAFLAVGGFDPAYRQGEDLDLVLKAVSLGPFVFVPEALVGYRHHGANTTRSHRDLAAGLCTILTRHREEALAAGRRALVSAYDDRLRANDRFAAWSAARAARAHLREKRFGAALGDIAWAARFAPSAPVSWLRARLDSRQEA